MLRENMRLIAECSLQLVRLGENLWGKEQELDKAEPLDVPTMTTDFVKEHGLPCPNGYTFKDENGNVIQATKIVLEEKKKRYPMTYTECCANFLGFGFKWDNPFRINRDTHPYIKHLDKLMEGLFKLLICREVYWRIAGDEMGLGKPWEPDWLDDDTKKYIITSSKVFETFGGLGYINYILTFPTEEMRDAFLENFEDLIEQCKELL